MSIRVDGIFVFILGVWWIFGIAVCDGFWSIAAAVCLPPYAMVMFARYLLGM